MKNNRLFPKGFSLIELLVVVMIILLVLSIGGNTYRSQRKHVAFTDSVAKVNNMIKLARDYTVTSRSAYDTTGCRPVGEEAFIPEEGYGIYISQSDTLGESRIVLFANTQADNDSELNQFNEGTGCGPYDFIEEEYLLPPEVDFVGLATDKLGTSIGGYMTDNEAIIIFSPPLADATITAGNTFSPDPTDMVYLDDLYMRFRRPDSASSIYIHINHIAGFPETEFE